MPPNNRKQAMLPEGAEFRPSEGMEGGHAVFDPPDVHEGGLQIQHVPLQADHFGHA